MDYKQQLTNFVAQSGGQSNQQGGGGRSAPAIPQVSGQAMMAGKQGYLRFGDPLPQATTTGLPDMKDQKPTVHPKQAQQYNIVGNAAQVGGAYLDEAYTQQAPIDPKFYKCGQ
jgi:hypothetical protein